MISVILGILLLAFLSHQLMMFSDISPASIDSSVSRMWLLSIELGITLVFSVIAFALWLGETVLPFSSARCLILGLLRFSLSAGLIMVNWKPSWYYFLDPVRPHFFWLVLILILGVLQSLGFWISARKPKPQKTPQVDAA